jgi:hypothetical protein
MSEDKTSATGNRWWEYYFLRYFVGTLVGAAIIVFLTKISGSPLDGLGLTELKDLGDLGIKEITGLGALGFAYCYVASAPMLLIHATRAQLGVNPFKLRVVFWLSSAGCTVGVFACAGWWLSIHWWSREAAALLVFLFVMIAQLATILVAQRNRLETISEFYWSLANARASEAPCVEEYVESYRHLREHGNAVSILVLEIALAFTISAARNLTHVILVMVLWLVPSSYTWFIGSVLESKLAHATRK